jgi:hypothetical protein
MKTARVQRGLRQFVHINSLSKVSSRPHLQNLKFAFCFMLGYTSLVQQWTALDDLITSLQVCAELMILSGEVRQSLLYLKEGLNITSAFTIPKRYVRDLGRTFHEFGDNLYLLEI